MTQKDRERIVRRHLYRYALYVRELRQYEQAVFGAPQHDGTGVRGSEISDPTARSGIALAEPPPSLGQHRRWIDAIDAAMNELAGMDGTDGQRMFGLDGQRHKRRENRDTALKIAIDCNLSVRAMYDRAGTIINTVIYHAAKAGLFEAKE